MTKHTRIVAGFPGVGKSYLCDIAKQKGLTIVDSDSRFFSCIREGEVSSVWPNNYIEHIRALIGVVDIICVSTHREVREALVRAGIHFVLVYPDIQQKKEYLDRFRTRPLRADEDRESRDQFVARMNKNWDDWIGYQLPHQKGCAHIMLQSGEHLSDIIHRLLTQ